MRVPVQIISFSCFLFSVTVVRGQEICTAPVISNGFVVEPVQEYQRDAILKYRCLPGFKAREGTPRCAKFGWTLNPECDEVTCELKSIRLEVNKINPEGKTLFRAGESVEITCTKRFFFAKQKLCPDLSVENGLIHKHSSNEEEIFYTCNTGYKPFSGNWWDSVTCSKGSWSEEPRCIRKEECGAFPSVHHGKLKKTKQIFHDGETTAFECDPGFIPTQRFIKCVSGTWETPVCEVDVHCGFPPKVENAFITSKPEEFYVHRSSITYACGSSFLMNGKSTVFCRSGTWEEVPTCKEVMCVANLTVNMRSDVTADEHTGPEVSVRSGHTITLSCVGKKVKLQGDSKITCLSNGEWNIPFPKCVGVDVHCGVPPKVENALITSKSEEFYVHGSSVTYVCRSSFLMNGKSTVFCRSGTWEQAPTCKGTDCADESMNVFCDTESEMLGLFQSPVQCLWRKWTKEVYSCDGVDGKRYSYHMGIESPLVVREANIQQAVT
uniref:Putative complement factor h-like 2 n=1 Tax=Ctenopharyngodon idella TaxID=7959 RepID=A0A3Q9U3T1_CTEID|nr:putative complement factor h-like 2 [Ctenopharyngodon idella]